MGQEWVRDQYTLSAADLKAKALLKGSPDVRQKRLYAEDYIMRRLEIRVFVRTMLLLLALLWVGGWVWSYFQHPYFRHAHKGQTVMIGLDSGAITLAGGQSGDFLRDGNWFWFVPYRIEGPDLFLGFTFFVSSNGPASWIEGRHWTLKIPLWFPTLLLLGVAVFEWRNRKRRRAQPFPMEVGVGVTTRP